MQDEQSAGLLPPQAIGVNPMQTQELNLDTVTNILKTKQPTAAVFDIKQHDQKVEDINNKIAELTAQMNKALAELANSKPKAPMIIGEAKGLMPVALKCEVAVTGTAYNVHIYIGQKIVHTCPAYAAQGQLQALAACIIKAFGEIPKEILDTVEVTYP